jgi:hypothetical protein
MSFAFSYFFDKFIHQFHYLRPIGRRFYCAGYPHIKGKDYDVAAFLVAYKIPDDIADYAHTFNINCKIITREMID